LLFSEILYDRVCNQELFVMLLIAWLGGFTVFHVASGLIHLLLVFVVISLILHFILGRSAA
jgi:Family of unknown function (DUF5670)